MLYNTSCFKKPKGATSGRGTAYPSGAPEFIPVFSGVRVTRSLVLCVYFVDVVCPFVIFLLCCLFFFDIRILIAPLISSNSSETIIYKTLSRKLYIKIEQHRPH